MILPLGDAPNPRGVPFMTYALIAANVAVYVLITLPLSGTAPQPTDPALREYVRVVTHDLPQVPVREILRGISTYDLFLFRHGFRPGHPEVGPLFYSLFLHAAFSICSATCCSCGSTVTTWSTVWVGSRFSCAT